MTDEELIARLRDWQEHDEGKINDAREAAADRIEAQAAEIERLRGDLATCKKYRDAYAEGDRIGTLAVRDLEAKLAKAVELALEECPFQWGTGVHNDWWHHRRTTLAELKGDKT